MKKWIIIAILLLLVGGIGMAFTFKDAFNQSTQSIEESFPLGDIDTLSVKSANSMVTIQPTSSDEITVTYEGNIEENILKTEVENNTLDIQMKTKWQYNIISFNLFSLVDKVKIELPQTLYEKITVDNDNGKIAIEEIESKSMDLTTDNGVIDAKKMTGNLSAQSANGVIKVHDIDGNIDIGTDNGALKIAHVTGDIIGKTSNGAIKYQADKIQQNIQLQSENGAIKITLSEALDDVLLDMKSELGTTKVNGNKDWQPKIGNGTYDLQLRTELGTIKIIEE